MEEVRTNLRVLRPSRKRRRPGDIFVYKMPDGLFRFGRLIATDASPLGVPANLVYFYRRASHSAQPVAGVSPHELLVPPVITNQKPWTLGYFEVVESRPLESCDRLLRHCFRDTRGQYFDEHGNQLPERLEPCGEWGLHSYRTIDDLLSDALGLARAP